MRVKLIKRSSRYLKLDAGYWMKKDVYLVLKNLVLWARSELTGFAKNP